MALQRKAQVTDTLRHDWQADDIAALFDLPFSDLMFEAQQCHRQHFDANAVQVSSLLSIKTGKCPEDCAHCPQSHRPVTRSEQLAMDRRNHLKLCLHRVRTSSPYT